MRKTETERERENELQGGGTRCLVGKKTTQESTDREYRRFAGDPFPLRSPALSYSAKCEGRGPVSGGHGLVACAYVAIYTQIKP